MGHHEPQRGGKSHISSAKLPESLSQLWLSALRKEARFMLHCPLLSLDKQNVTSSSEHAGA